jgi:16S rRNA (cytidine1402-2'-O)-methyltransferase
VTEARGTLWIVATPIGSIQDLGARAREVLGGVDLILAEDTRRARALLSHAGVRAGRRLRSLHQHNEAKRVPAILEALIAGGSAALISDAGTPVLSDPGYLLVRTARRERIAICSVPGPSAFTAALAASGQPPLPAVLVGYLPHKAGHRRRQIRRIADWPHTLVVFLSPHRLRDELADLAEELGTERPATLLAELSKVHERGLMETLGELVASQEVSDPRGEYVVVVGPAVEVSGPSVAATADVVRAAYDDAVAEGADRREAIRQVSRDLGLARRRVFEMLIDSDSDKS